MGTRDSGAWLEDVYAWVVDSGASIHMMGVRSILLSVIEIDSYYYVNNGMCTRHAVKGVGIVVFQLELGISLEVVGVMYVLRISVSLLSMLALEDEGYTIMLWDG